MRALNQAWRATLVLAALGAASCGTAAPPSLPSPGSAATTAAPAPRGSVAAEPPPALPSSVLDDGKVCDKATAKPPPHEFKGILRGVRCEEQMYLTMANVARQLGVECTYCHAKSAKSDELDHAAPTPKKEIANWMSQHFVQAVRRKDGGLVTCRTCHVDDAGKPVAKILGEPRDQTRTHEWMTLTLIGKFTGARGEPLKCRACHGGNYSTPDWRSRVLLDSEHIPPHNAP